MPKKRGQVETEIAGNKGKAAGTKEKNKKPRI